MVIYKIEIQRNKRYKIFFHQFSSDEEAQDHWYKSRHAETGGGSIIYKKVDDDWKELGIQYGP